MYPVINEKHYSPQLSSVVRHSHFPQLAEHTGVVFLSRKAGKPPLLEFRAVSGSPTIRPGECFVVTPLQAHQLGLKFLLNPFPKQ